MNLKISKPTKIIVLITSGVIVFLLLFGIPDFSDFSLDGLGRHLPWGLRSCLLDWAWRTGGLDVFMEEDLHIAWTPLKRAGVLVVYRADHTRHYLFWESYVWNRETQTWEDTSLREEEAIRPLNPKLVNELEEIRRRVKLVEHREHRD